MKRISYEELLKAINSNPRRDGKKLGIITGTDSLFRDNMNYVAQAQLEADRKDMRELFEEIESIGRNDLGFVHFIPEEWQAFKEKYLK